MQRRFPQLICLFLLLAVPVGARLQNAAGNDASRPIQHVIIISVDGLKPQSYTEPGAHGLKVPTMRTMVRDGASSDGVQSVLPSVTFPSHTAMVTGTNPGTSGIISNPGAEALGTGPGGWRWYEEDIRTPTIWQLARQRGLRTALVLWPMTAGAPADLNVPEFSRAATRDDLKLLRALSTPSGVFAEVAKMFPDFPRAIMPPDQTDAAFADIACYAIEKLQPNLLLLHLPTVDGAEHEKGPFSAEAIAATELADTQIARVIASAKKAGIWESTILVVLSDHGFAPISKDYRPGALMREHGLVTLDAQDHPVTWKASLLNEGGSAFIYLKDENDDATRRLLLDIFKPLAGVEGSGIRRVATHGDIVAMGGDPNAFLALEAADGYVFVPGYAGDLVAPSKRGGAHGYFPDRPEMRASLIVYGPPIAHGKIENAREIDVGPTVARWLGLEMTKAEGKPLAIPMR
jgi:predicted AlkP superfamily pyrophosphatase or phosphodiesterase